MKLEIKRQDFLKAWQDTEKLALKNSNESSKGVLLTASEENTIMLEATDLSMSLRCFAEGAKVLEPGKAVIPAAIFGGLLKKLNADDITLDVDSTRGLLNAGSNKMRFAVISPDSFPKINGSEGAETVCEIPAPVLGKLISEGSTASSQPQDFPKYMGTCLLRTSEGTLTAVSTDGKRLSLSKSVCSSSKDADLLLPAQALKDFGKSIVSMTNDDNVKILSDNSSAWFVLKDKEYSIRSVDSTFPRYERILNDNIYTTLRINANDLLRVLERIDVIARTTIAHIMAIALQPNGEIRITARAPELGTTSETFTADVQGGYLQLGFNVEYFMSGLKALGNEEAVIEFSGEEEQARMKRDGSDDFLYMLMPARLSHQDSMTEDEIGDFSGISHEQSESPNPEQPVNEPSPEYEPAPEPEQESEQEYGESDTPF